MDFIKKKNNYDRYCKDTDIACFILGILLYYKQLFLYDIF